MALRLRGNMEIKGGAGSGNWGHAGRPGKRGGSSSRGGGQMSMDLHSQAHPVSKPSLTDFLQQWKLEQFDTRTNKPVGAALADLPPAPAGATRVLHGTSLANMQSIDKTGLRTGAEVGKKEHLTEVLGYSEAEYGRQGANSFGELVVVADVPAADVRAINQGWLSVRRSIKPEEIAGYLIGKVQVDASELPQIFADYNRRYGGQTTKAMTVRVARLLEIKGGVGDTSDLAMVALFVPPAVGKRLRIPGGEEPPKMHVTLAFLGEIDKISDPAGVRRVVQDIARQHGPLTGVINGIGRFIQTHKEGQHAVYASPDLPGLPDLRHALVQALARVGMPQQSEHGFVPHITLNYVDAATPTPAVLSEPVPVEFAALSIEWGGKRTDYPLTGGEIKGGAGSGNWGHAGRPGKRGGSMSRGQAMSVRTGKDASLRQQRRRVEAGLQAVARPTTKQVAAARAVIEKEHAKLRKYLERAGKGNAALVAAEKKAVDSFRAYSGYIDSDIFKKSKETIDRFWKIDDQVVCAKLDGRMDDYRRFTAEKNAMRKEYDAAQKISSKAYKLSDAATMAENAYRKKQDEAIGLQDKIKAMHAAIEPHRETIMAHEMYEAKAVRDKMAKSGEQLVKAKAELADMDKRIEKIADRMTEIMVTQGDLVQKHGYPIQNNPAAQAEMDELDRLMNAYNTEWDTANAGRFEKANEVIKLKLGQPQLVNVKKPGQLAPKIDTSMVDTSKTAMAGWHQAQWEDGVTAFNRLVGTGTLDNVDIAIKSLHAQGWAGSPPTSKRACYDCGVSFRNGTVYMDDVSGKDVAVHELGHALEDHDPFVHKKALEFLARRTAGEQNQQLKTLTGNPNYEDSEIAKPDKFTDPYMGKDYKGHATEIVSMGLQNFATDPATFAKRDPDYFDFIYSLMRTGG